VFYAEQCHATQNNELNVIAIAWLFERFVLADLQGVVNHGKYLVFGFSDNNCGGSVYIVDGSGWTDTQSQGSSRKRFGNLHGSQDGRNAIGTLRMTRGTSTGCHLFSNIAQELTAANPPKPNT
jgi:hypothetical protein